jgi:hypothetical protein
MAICIAGMHRSGTSLVARVLKECGVYLGPEEELLPAGRDNRDGFWENAALAALNDEILRVLGGAWDNPPAFPDGWEELPELAPLEERAKKLLAPLRERSPWGWKDPRNSLTLPFWRRVVEEELRLVVSVRHPAEIVASLTARGGMSSERAAGLCLAYADALERGTGGYDRVVVSYETLLADPEPEVARLAAALDLDPGSLELARAIERVNHALRHQVAGPRQASNGLSPRLLASYEGLAAEAALGGTRVDPPEPATQLEAARGLLHESRRSVYLLQDELADLRQRSQAEIAELRQSFEARIAELHERARETARSHRREIGALKDELARCGDHVDALASELRTIKETRLFRVGVRWWALKAGLRNRLHRVR